MRIVTILLIGHLLVGAFPAWASIERSSQTQPEEQAAGMAVQADCHTSIADETKNFANNASNSVDTGCAQHCLTMTALPADIINTSIQKPGFSAAVSVEHTHVDPTVIQPWRPPSHPS